MDQTLQSLKDEFECYVGQCVKTDIYKQNVERIIDGQLQKVTQHDVIVDVNDPLVKAMYEHARKIGTQLSFDDDGAMMGVAGTVVNIELARESDARHVITGVRPAYC